MSFILSSMMHTLQWGSQHSGGDGLQFPHGAMIPLQRHEGMASIPWQGQVQSQPNPVFYRAVVSSAPSSATWAAHHSPPSSCAMAGPFYQMAHAAVPLSQSYPAVSQAAWEQARMAHAALASVPSTPAPINPASSQQWRHAQMTRAPIVAVPSDHPGTSMWHGASSMIPVSMSMSVQDYMQRQAPGGDSPPTSAGHHVMYGHEASGASPCIGETEEGMPSTHDLEADLQRPRSAFTTQCAMGQYQVTNGRGCSPTVLST